jgi:hypothetical protein
MVEVENPAQTFDQTVYKEKSRKLISLVNQLRDAVAQFQLELPCMVVCGNQSAGESYLLHFTVMWQPAFVPPDRCIVPCTGG